MRHIQREFEVQLPIGYTDTTGQTHRQAVIRKMTGHEESLLYDTTLNAGQLVTALIRACLIRLGNLETIDPNIISQLYTADRNYLLLELRRITLGNQLNTTYLCPQCGADVSVVEDLGQIEVRRLEDGRDLEDITVDLEDGYIDRERALHTRLIMTLPRGADEEFVSPMVERDPLKAQEALILRCIKSFGTLPKVALEAYGVKILRDLTLGDRQRLHLALNNGTPGVNFQRTLHCEMCKTKFEGVLDISSFFILT